MVVYLPEMSGRRHIPVTTVQSRYGQAIKDRREWMGFKSQNDLIMAIPKEVLISDDLRPFSQQWLSKMERDRDGSVIAGARGQQLRTLAYMLNWTLADMQAMTGVHLGATTGWTRAGSVSPANVHIEIPASLQRAAQQYPALASDRVMRALAAPMAVVSDVRAPDNPTDWYEYYLVNRRWLPTA